MSMPNHTALLGTLSRDELFEVAVALSSHIATLAQIISGGIDDDSWRAQLTAAERAHDVVTAARIAA